MRRAFGSTVKTGYILHLSVMMHLRRCHTACLGLLVGLILGGMMLAGPVGGATLIYKNYIIRRDGDRDIFCEPHVVKPNEYVLKIFRNRGEIAHRAFGEFLSIFKRLNPNIPNIDKLQPGQLIFIPLKILSPGDLADRKSDVVTIPFVTISKNDARLKRFTKRYLVQPGDFVSMLVARDFGRYGSRSYWQGIKLFKLLNKDIVDLNRIKVGQSVNLIDPAIRGEPWYEAIFNRQTAAVQSEPAPMAKTTALAKNTANRSLAQVLNQLTTLLGGRLKRVGKYHFPVQNQGRVTIDLAVNPMLRVGNRTKILFLKNPLSDPQKKEIQKSFKNLFVIDLPAVSTQDKNKPVPPDKIEKLLNEVFVDLGDKRSAPVLTRTIDGIDWKIRPQWLLTRPPNDLVALKETGFTLVQNPSQRTPIPVVRYLAKHGIIIREFVYRNNPKSADGASDNRLQKDATVLTGSLKAEMSSPVSMRRILAAMGYRFTPNASIRFPYAGIQITARSNLVTADHMPPLFVDFGELYGEAIDAIQKAGFRMLHFGRRDPAEEIVPAILKELGIAFSPNPEFGAAKRAKKYNALFTIPGFLLKETKPDKILIALVPVHKTVAILLKNRGITVYTVRQPVRL